MTPRAHPVRTIFALRATTENTENTEKQNEWAR